MSEFDKTELDKLGEAAAQHWGSRQLTVCIEEMAELTQRLCHVARGRVRIEGAEVAEELADVYVALASLRSMVDRRLFEALLEARTLRLRQRLELAAGMGEEQRTARPGWGVFVNGEAAPKMVCRDEQHAIECGKWLLAQDASKEISIQKVQR